MGAAQVPIPSSRDSGNSNAVPATTLQAADMHAAAEKASDLLKSLANRHRLLIVCQLVEGERSVGELAAFVDTRDSTVSQHLALLRKDGVVKARRDGQTIWYSIANPTARAVIETLYQAYCAPASSPIGVANDRDSITRNPEA
jgi:DNA-binding transcriptional ArsR family regulator